MEELEGMQRPTRSPRWDSLPRRKPQRRTGQQQQEEVRVDKKWDIKDLDGEEGECTRSINLPPPFSTIT